MSAVIQQQMQPEDAASPARDEDFVLWAAAQAELIRSGAWKQLDSENLIEELISMAGRDRRELKHRLTVLIAHLLKCSCQPERTARSWRSTIIEQRSQIDLVLDDSPSLRDQLPLYAAQVYAIAVRKAAAETGLPEASFPPDNPFSIGQIMASGFPP